MNAQAYSDVLQGVLRTCPSTGRVHSVFASSANLQFGERLVHLGTSRQGDLPYGVLLQDRQMIELLAMITLGEAVAWDKAAGTFRFASGLTVSLSGGVPFSSVPRSLSFSGEILRRNAACLIGQLAADGAVTGFGVNAEDAALCLFGLQEEPPDFFRLTGELKNVILSEDPIRIKQVLRKVIGRGQGLTPSGDDLLVGCLIGAVYGGTRCESFCHGLRELLLEEGRRLTTEVSQEYLLYALDNRFGSRIRRLADALFAGSPEELQSALQETLAVGHTSGIDTVMGLILWISLWMGEDSIG
ncbi:DUF2877 domain-containing protein [Brevibacillus borstelensis]|uniref:DUF2877 domain-containing protein n=1 Tax=Brevibacillus borstelensis TaxID=45462 RepID=UPI0030BBC058